LSIDGASLLSLDIEGKANQRAALVRLDIAKRNENQVNEEDIE
jgi:hypothetical protein